MVGRVGRYSDFSDCVARGMIQYNLACYSAQLGQLDAAKEFLGKSYELGDAQRIKLMALDDEDLKPLWESEAQ